MHSTRALHKTCSTREQSSGALNRNNGKAVIFGGFWPQGSEGAKFKSSTGPRTAIDVSGKKKKKEQQALLGGLYCEARSIQVFFNHEPLMTAARRQMQLRGSSLINTSTAERPSAAMQRTVCAQCGTCAPAGGRARLHPSLRRDHLLARTNGARAWTASAAFGSRRAVGLKDRARVRPRGAPCSRRWAGRHARAGMHAPAA